MTAHSIPILLLFGISLYAGISHLLYFMNRKESRESLYFSLICFSIAFYDAMCIGLYNADSVLAGSGWQKGQYFAICFLVIAFLYFIFALADKKITWPARAFVVSMIASIAAGFVFPNLIVSVHEPSIKDTAVFGFRIRYYEAETAVLMNTVYALTAGAMIYFFYILLTAYRQRQRKDTLPLLIGIIAFFVSTFLDMLVSSNFIEFMFTSEYSFIILIFMMDFAFQKRFVHLFQEVETMNVKLEDRVKARTTDINGLLDELSVVNSELEEKNKALQELSERDSLTNLLNHAAFHGRLAEMFNAARRQHFSLAVLMIDIDHFKLINDRYGHPVGDRIIKKVAEVLMSGSRNYDVKARYSEKKQEAPATNIRKYDVAGRYGGDEFAVLLPYCSEKEVGVITERIRSRIQAIRLDDTPDLQVSASMGGVVFDQKVPCQDERKLIQQADQALYQAKKSGRNQVVISPFTC